ncbi:UNVERIFIED_CONTAM: hypothetical protein FKN15_069059 [Acipenser sinensis]
MISVNAPTLPRLKVLIEGLGSLTNGKVKDLPWFCSCLTISEHRQDKYAKVLLDAIKAEVQGANSVAVMVDETTNVGNAAQLSCVFRDPSCTQGYMFGPCGC